MRNPVLSRSLETSRKWRYLHRIIVVAIGMLLVTGGIWLCVQRIRQRTLLKKLPVPLNLTGLQPAVRDQILQLDAEVRASPRSVDKIGILGITYHANQSFDQALICYQLAIGLSPNDYRWPYYLAIIKEELGQEDQAIKLLNHVTQLNPGYAHAWARLGNLLRRSHRLDEAKTAFSLARNLEPLHPYACLGMARIAAYRGDWVAVATTLEPMLQAHPLFAPALRLLSQAYIQMGRKPPFGEADSVKVPIEDVIDEPLLDALYERSALALTRGNPDRGKVLLPKRCSRCHTITRIQQAHKSASQWLHTIGRMQGQAGREWLSDSDAADILSYLVNRPHG